MKCHGSSCRRHGPGPRACDAAHAERLDTRIFPRRHSGRHRKLFYPKCPTRPLSGNMHRGPIQKRCHRAMNTTRRSLLKGLAASAVAAPFILPPHVRAADTKANARLTMGFIGMGTQSRGLLGGFLGHDTQVLAVCDVDRNRREDAKKRVEKYYDDRKRTSKCDEYADFRELLARKDIDAVCIATPDHWHAIITLAALRAGKDVYCEKPLTHNIHEAVEVIRAVDAQKRVLQTGSMQRSM